MRRMLRLMALSCVFLATAGVADEHPTDGAPVTEVSASEMSVTEGASLESAAPAPQRIYRSVGEDGVPSFSSESVTGAEEIELKPSNSVRITPTKPSSFTLPAEPEKKEYKVSITSPEHDKHYHNDPNPVPVVVSVVPGLAEGYRLEVLDNGSPIAAVDGKYVLTLPERGEHQLTANVLNDRGEVQAASEPVTIYVHRVSQITNPQFRPTPKRRGKN